MNKVDLLAYSVSKPGHELMTFQVETNVATWIQLLTHRSATKNAASKRAIPTEKQIDAVMVSPFLPEVYWKNQKRGMQPSEQFEDVYQGVLDDLMREYHDGTIQFAKKLNNIGVSRQQVGNLLMPFQVIKGIVTFPGYGFDNFIKLRMGHNTGAQHEISELAKLMHNAVQSTTPKQLLANQWHIPYATDGLALQQNIEKSVACTAFVSYDSIEKQRTASKYKQMHDKLEAMEHWSCFQHIHQCQGDSYMYEACLGFASLREIKQVKKREVKYNTLGLCTIEDFLEVRFAGKHRGDVELHSKLNTQVLEEYKLRNLEVDTLFKRNLLNIALLKVLNYDQKTTQF